MSARKTKKNSRQQDTSTALQSALAAFEKSEGPFYDGMKLLKQAQKDFAACAKNKNLYSHALRALRHIAKQPCETPADVTIGVDPAKPCCWPCFARDALRQGGDKA